MATGGIFTIITNDGKQDRMLMATALLHERLRAINVFKTSQQGGAADALQNLPTLLDIEKTHVLFTNAHFKPFAAIGFEYNKVKPTSGNPTLGQTIQFSIPQFGDFFHDICGHVVLVQPTLNSTASATYDAPLMRWCAFPGERLFQKVQQEVNGNPLDEYTFHATNMYRYYKVAPNKQVGWNRCMGQEEAHQGFVDQPTWTFNNYASSAIVSRVEANVHIGSQTPTGQKDQTSAGNLELFIPLLFWYNLDVRLAVPSVAIPYGQRFINIELAQLSQLVNLVPRGAGTWASPNGSITESTPTLQSIELYINNIFVNPEIHKIYIKRIGFSLIRVHRQQTYNANTSSAEVLLQQLKWPIEYMFVGMKVKKYYLSSSTADQAQYLEDWDSFTQVTQTTYTTQGQNVQLLRAAISAGTLVVTAATGSAAPTGGNWNQAVAVGDLFLAGGVYLTATATAVAGSATAVIMTPTLIANLTTTAANTFKVSEQGLQVTAPVYARTLDTLEVTAHGISLYLPFPSKFYNAYLSLHFGGPNINTPTDRGLCFIPFALYPGTYQPSGHINISRAREFYINYTSSVIDGTTEGVLVVIASAINFLLISDGSAVLRYST